MAWDPTVPAEDNQVRANDLPKIRANWDMLTPMVVSGLNGLPDVELVTVSGNQVLGWTGTEWGNIDNVLSGLGDVDVSGVVSGEVLKYDGAEWVPGVGSSVSGLDDLQDVDLTGQTSGHVLTYDGNEWKPDTPSGGGGGFVSQGTRYEPDAPPLNPATTYNDEFDGDMSKWTVWEPTAQGMVASVASGLNLADHMRMYHAWVGSPYWCGVYMDTTGLDGTDYSFIAKLGATGSWDANNDIWMGLVAFAEDVIGSPATAGFYGMLSNWRGDNLGNGVSGHVGFYAITDYQDVTPILIGTSQNSDWHGNANMSMYYRLTWQENGPLDNELSGWLSTDGQNWVKFGNVWGSPLSWDPYGIGIVMYQSNPASVVGLNYIKANFVRHQPGQDFNALTLSGAMVKMAYDY